MRNKLSVLIWLEVIVCNSISMVICEIRTVFTTYCTPLVGSIDLHLMSSLVANPRFSITKFSIGIHMKCFPWVERQCWNGKKCARRTSLPLYLLSFSQAVQILILFDFRILSYYRFSLVVSLNITITNSKTHCTYTYSQTIYTLYDTLVLSTHIGIVSRIDKSKLYWCDMLPAPACYEIVSWSYFLHFRSLFVRAMKRKY